jgi:peptidoglycan LD-endopeptidase LytH
MNNQPLIEVLRRHAPNFSPVVAFNPETEKLISIEFTEDDRGISSDVLSDTKKFSDHINQKLQAAGAKFGIGGYTEKRDVYSRSSVFNGEGKEPRRVHLGIDIWGKPYTPVMSPMDGIVHSFAFNNSFGDYGATLILTHHLEGISFHTLYGHLSLNSIKDLREGSNVKKGDVIAEFGIPFENGQWPPHLHFQVIMDMENWKGDYPGVCAESEKEAYFANCPDPDVILNMRKWATANVNQEIVNRELS